MNKHYQGARWGFWMTCVWFAMYLLVTQLVLSVGVITGFAVRADVPLQWSAIKRFANGSELMIMVSLIVNILSVPFIALMVFSKKGSRWIDYMAWRRVGIFRVFGWVFLSLLVVYLSGVLHHLMGWPDSGFMKEVGLGQSPIVLILAVAVAAPICEELVFRGFMYAGFERSLGAWPAVILTSVVFTLMHWQYNPYELIHILLLGLVLALARMRTRSMWTPMVMHAVNNGLALLTVLIKP